MNFHRNDQDRTERDIRLQEQAERAEREQLPPGDPGVDRYRLVVRALRQPLEPQLADDFAACVAGMALAKEERGLEDALLVVLMLGLGIVALLFVGPAIMKAIQAVVSITPPSLPSNQLLAAALGIGFVWAIERGWVHLHPAATSR